jgi:D-alanyl-D-alanine dipeptidase
VRAAAPAAPPPTIAAAVGDYAAGGERRVLLERNGALRLRDTAGRERPIARADVADSVILVDGIPWTRARVAGGEVARIRPLRSVAALRAAAMEAEPPANAPGLAPPDLVELRSLDSTIHYDIRYASTDNFMGERFYDTALAFLQRPAAEALVRAHRRLGAAGYGLLIHDAYRPWAVTWMFWQATPDSQKIFVADPATGSRHNRGAAVDVTLYERATGAALAMPSAYDEFSPRAFPAYPGGTSRERWHRGLLRLALEAEGFRVYRYEWWHFDYADWERYPILNVRFGELAARGR